MAPTLQQSGYNIVRDDKVLLDAYNNSPPSFVINLFPSHWTLNNGPKFMYNNQVSSILEDIRAFRIPVDFVDVFDRVGVQYYEGCLIVEIVDYRPSKPKDPLLENPDIQRVVCRPNSETIWKDICRLNENHGYKMTDMEALEIEAKILLQTSHPLCLDPDPHLTRIVNNVLRVSTPNIPNSLKRKAASQADLEEDEAEKAKRAKLMQFMNPRAGRAINPSYRILALRERTKFLQAQGAGQPVAAPRPPQAPMQISHPVPPPVQDTSSPQKDATRSVSATPAQPHVQLPQHNAQQPVSSIAQQQTAQRQPQQSTAQQTAAAAAASASAAEVVRKPTPVAQPSAPSPRPTQPPSRPVSTVPQHNPAAPPQPAMVQPVQFPPPPANFLKNPPPNGKRRSTVVGNPPAPAPAPQNPPPVPAQLVQPPPPQQPQNAPTQAPTPQQTQTQPALPPPAQHPIPYIVHQQPNQHHLPVPMAPFVQRPGMNTMAYPPAQVQQLRQQSNSGRSSPANTNSSPIRPASAAMTHNSPLAPNAIPQGVQGRNSPMVGEQVSRQSPMVPSRTLSAQPHGTPQPQPQQIQQHSQQQQQVQPHPQPQPQPAMHPQQPMQAQPLTQQQQLLYMRQQQILAARQQQLLQQQQQQQQQQHQHQQNRPPTVPPGGQMQMVPQQMAQPHLMTREQSAGAPHAFPGIQMTQVTPQLFQYQQSLQTQQHWYWMQQQAHARNAMAGRGAGPPIPMTPQMMAHYQQQLRNAQAQGQMPNR